MNRLGPTEGHSARVRGIDNRRLRGHLWMFLSGATMLPFAMLGARGDFGASADMRWFGSLMILISSTGFVLPTIELSNVLRRPGPRQRPAPSGRPSRAYTYSRWIMAFHVLMTLLGGILCVGFGWVLMTRVDGQLDVPRVFGAPIFLAGLWLLSYLVPWVMGRVHVGGVYLTADGVEYRRGSMWWEASWADIRYALPVEPCLLILKDGAKDRMRMGRTTRWGWVISFRQGPKHLEFDGRFLASHPGDLSDTIAACLSDPGVRAGIGDPHRTW